ncbi:FAD-linked sulfhydryl oxidase ALR [Jimgerdemannia flammicorona]|uniref:Sulfhydryl oxidase n=1 Tax=Jimgerdemannia flammicorona TaxID=994334 RepID=A0A433DEN7_9FUNG|nr:FAD-linked sulfhydryl oxidase ALR [Jimgerdemannia flammicorona]
MTSVHPTPPNSAPAPPLPKHTTTKDPATGKTVPLTDGKPCRTCVDWKTWRKLGKDDLKKKSSATGSESTPFPTTTAADAAAATASSSQPGPNTSSPEWRAQNCPADSETLGRATWTFLHTMAAYYPDTPTPSQEDSMRTFLKGFAQFYPCWYCAEDFRSDTTKNPPAVQSRERLGRWLCERHNEVNRKLGKDEFDCARVLERWRDGPKDGSCD